MSIKSLPEAPGIYKFFNCNNKIIYVGKAVNLKKRVTSYFSNKNHDPKTIELVSNIDHFEVIITKDEYSALILENDLIKQYWPKYNIALKDDKSYPFIEIDDSHQFPGFTYHVGPRHTGCNYLGPYTDKLSVKDMLREVQKIFLIRSCSKHQFRQKKACLLYQIKRCSAPCENKISHESYQQYYQEAKKFLQGQHAELLENWQQQMLNCAKEKDYEQAAYFRDLIRKCHRLSGKNQARDSLDIVLLSRQADQCHLAWFWIRDGFLKGKQEFQINNPMAASDSKVLKTLLLQILTSMPGKFGWPDKILVDISKQDWSEVQKITGHYKIKKVQAHTQDKWLNIAQQNLDQSLKRLAVNWSDIIYSDPEINSILNLKAPPVHTECFDISHTAGKNVYASCVVFDASGPNKRLYRSYKIPFDDKPDDYRSLKYVFNKRYSGLDKLPDLIVVDGGKGQLNVVLQVLSNTKCAHIPVIAISKGPTRKEGAELLHTRIKQDFKVSTYNQALYSLLLIRNEAHRFAIKQHRQARQSSSIKFKLEQVAGISAAKRKALYSYFGGLDGLRSASLDDIKRVPGIGAVLASKIVEFLQNN